MFPPAPHHTPPVPPLRLDYGRSPHAYVNQRLQIHLELLMMSGVPLETCWAFNKRWNNKFYYKVASCWLFLLSHTTMHGSMNIKSDVRYFHYKWIEVPFDDELRLNRLFSKDKLEFVTHGVRVWLNWLRYCLVAKGTVNGWSFSSLLFVWKSSVLIAEEADPYSRCTVMTVAMCCV
jgi:hypothetical protein